jgi:hypothetical protein
MSNPGQRRGLVDQYYAGTDWTDPVAVRRILNVYEQALVELDLPEDERRRLIHHLRRDGYQVVDDRISSGPASEVADIPLGSLTDPAVIEDHLNRIRDAIDSDPNLAIGSAKELIESTAKLVITEMGQTYSSGDDIPALVRKAQRALRLDADAIAPDARGADTIRRILSSLSQVAIGVAELRNLYGTGHGRDRRPSGIGPRHARLAVGSARVYCHLLLDTLAAHKDRQRRS